MKRSNIATMSVREILDHLADRVGMIEVLAHLVERDDCEGYGYTVERDEEIASLRNELETMKRVLPERLRHRIEREELSLADLLEVEARLCS